MFKRRKIEQPYEGRIEPFKIIGNVYFVGTFQASAHLIDTGDGLILIDPGYSNTLYLVVSSIYKLGFKPEDIKYIINTHWHYDHTEATKALSEMSNAKTIIGIEDYEKAQRFFVADIKVKAVFCTVVERFRGNAHLFLFLSLAALLCYHMFL